jgi:hypothetical protein
MPDWKAEVRRRLLALQLAHTRENAIVEELAAHLDEAYAELLASGVSEADAYRQMRAELHDGGLLTHELQRIERSPTPAPLVLGTNRRTNMIADLRQDLRFGARMLLKNPGFTLIVLLTLNLGIGANTAIFSVVNAVMLRQLPFANADRLVRLNESNPERGWPTFSVSSPNFLDWRARNQSFEGLAATIGENFNLNAGGEIEVVRGASVTTDFLPVLGVTPMLGRNFLFTVMGIPCLGLNGRPEFKHNEAFSFQVATVDQAETDRYWNAIVGNGGAESACGWCKDKWGLSWQITPVALTEAVTDPDPAVAKRAFEAMMQMKKIDIAAVKAARRG